jgi:hypothetical protein
LSKLEPIINELIPHKADLTSLEIAGKSVLNDGEKNITKSDKAYDTWANPNIDTNFIINYENQLKSNIEDTSEDTLDAYENVTETPSFGPSLIFGGQKAKWTGFSNDNESLLGLESRLNFETKAGKRVLGIFEIFNNGTCTIAYDWKVSIYND